MYLLIDTSTRFGAVGLWSLRDRYLLRVRAWHTQHNHTSELMPAVQGVLEAVGAGPADIRGIGVTHGPGGFSALRAGLGVAKGLAFALTVPVVGVSTLEAAAYQYRGAGLPLCSVIEAGRGFVAWARFQQTADGWRRRTPDRVTPFDQLLAGGGRHTLFCGEGVGTYAEHLREAMGARAHLVVEPMPLSRLQGLADLAAARLEAGEADPPAGLEPRYLRAPAITQPNPPHPVRYGGMRQGAPPPAAAPGFRLPPE